MFENQQLPLDVFLVASYSCLPSLIAQLEISRSKSHHMLVVCLTSPLYQFLKKLETELTIQIILVDIKARINYSPKRPLSLLKNRITVRDLFNTYFDKIPDGCCIFFFNVYFAQFVGYIVWQLRKRCKIFYIPCDPLDLYTTDNRFTSQIILKLHQVVYPYPFEMVVGKNVTTRHIPALSDLFLQETVTETKQPIIDLTTIIDDPIFESMTWEYPVQVLWVMGLVLDYDEVQEEPYLQIMMKCVQAVDDLFSPNFQAVKFHPRSQQHEQVWSDDVAIIPDYIPAEFLKLPNLRAVLAVSSASISSIPATVPIIGLANLLPYKSLALRERHISVFNHYSGASQKYLPSSIIELNAILSALLQSK